MKMEESLTVNNSDEFPFYWFETSDSVSRRFQFLTDGHLSMKIVDDARPIPQKMVEFFLNNFFPSGYPYSVNEGYLSSNFSADMLYDFGTGLGNFAKLQQGQQDYQSIHLLQKKEILAIFLPKEKLSQLFLMLLVLVLGFNLRRQFVHQWRGSWWLGRFFQLYMCLEHMRGVPINTLNPQRTALVVANFVKTGQVPSPSDLRFQVDLLFPERPIQEAGNVRVGRTLHKALKPSKVQKLKQVFSEEKFLLSQGKSWTDMVLEHDATGEDALRGWLVAAYAKSMTNTYNDTDDIIMLDAYDKMNDVFNPFLSQVQAKGWYTDRFLDGTGTRFAW